MARSRWIVIVVLFATWLISYFDRSLIATALPFIGHDFGLSSTLKGFVSSAFFIGYAAVQIPGGVLADRVGPRRVAFAAVLGWSIFCALTGAAGSILTLITVRVLFGLAEGAFSPASWKVLSMTVDETNRARANALMLTSNLVGPALAPIVLVPFIASIGWRPAFWCVAIPGIFAAIACLKYLPAATNGFDDKGKAQSEALPIAAEPISMRKALMNPVIGKLFLIWGTWDIAWWGFLSWVPSYLYSGRSFSLEKTGLLASLPFVVGIVGMLVAGYAADRIAKRRTVIMVCLAGNAAFLTLLAFANTPATAITCLIGVGFFLPAMYGPFWSLPMQLLPSSLMGAGAGLINFAGQIAGFVSPIVIGYTVGVTGTYTAGFLFLAAAAVTCFLITATLREPAREFSQAVTVSSAP
ncbi:MFS transporter [Mycobacterium stomatepiae]|uniref:MFS transporter n=1 Tax=Mycobacterium stomatepiae TaxID=470076 RepID=A0A7I7Q0I1_9MYCO|nr:MFS transporter [Mycobacterium stomatepiae]MCV7166257.1 MFS transporter [Mycobacterium stomatepiae]BBY19920.1 MFS transporter [Mycobacterium stomatepiae]